MFNFDIFLCCSLAVASISPLPVYRQSTTIPAIAIARSRPVLSTSITTPPLKKKTHNEERNVVTYCK